MKNSGCLYSFCAIFALAGLGSGFFGVMNLIKKNNIQTNGVKTTGTVFKLRESHSGKGSTTYAPVIEFRDTDGNLTVYNSTTYTNVDPYKIGERVELWYLPANPEWDVVIEGSDAWIYFPFIFLFTHGGVGISGLVWLERKRRLHKWLHEQGQEVNARFVRVDVSRGKSDTYTLICAWKEPYVGNVYEFKSESMTKNPEDFIAPDSTSIRVLIDPNNLERYWVDMGFMGE